MITFLQFFISLLIIYSGLFAGLALAHIAKEEIKPGVKYFEWMKKIILATVFFLLLTKFSIASMGLAVLAAGNYFLVKKKIGNFDKDIVHYLLFGILLGLSSNNPELLLLEGALVFLYGVPAGTILKNNNSLKVAFLKISSYLIFFIGALLGNLSSGGWA